MASKEELEKLTVVQIREKLKSRKLPVTGSKSELVNRLFDSLMVEENLLEEGPGGESIDLSGVNMDEVLGLDDEKDTHSSTTANEDVEEGKEKQSASFDVTDEKRKTSTDDASKMLKCEKDTHSSTTANEDVEEGKVKQSDSVGLTDGKRKTSTDDGSKMLKLAERFGLPLKRGVSETEQSEALAKREKRFGKVVGSGDMGKTSTDEDTKMLKRAERFGLPLKRGGISETEQSEALAKREKRFGKVIGSGDVETKKEARIKRFGVVS
ncbi:hypothetical protein ACQ4LE_003805 [Meloidogyne hapla]|uniref:SAP domain-containing protein n=1 Tax=Meloidogyne hapla TaxID=6305 RepID=A0A1I8BZ95_MELHA